VELRILGPSGLRVSELCLGVATFGNDDWGCDEAESARILDRYLDAGGNFLDTANKYADGRSEEVVGSLLGSRRDRIVLGTKYTAAMEPDPNSGGNHRKSLVRSLEASLRRLRTDYVDILWVHAWDGVTPIDEVVRALDDQVRLGKVLSLGISNAPPWIVGYANAYAACTGRSPFVAVQNEYNLLQRGAERELLPMTKYFELGFLAWAPVAQGRLTGKHLRDEPTRLSREEAAISAAAARTIGETVAVAEELGAAPATVAIRWLVQRQPHAIPIVGVRTLEQLEANLRVLELELSPEQESRLDEVSAIDLGSPTRFMRTNDSGRNFMWGTPRTVPPTTGRPGEPWWEL
jgi:aryl-alcohol dehydrogenase-like predicted oxidoreductase